MSGGRTRAREDTVGQPVPALPLDQGQWRVKRSTVEPETAKRPVPGPRQAITSRVRGAPRAQPILGARSCPESSGCHLIAPGPRPALQCRSWPRPSRPFRASPACSRITVPTQIGCPQRGLEQACPSPRGWASHPGVYSHPASHPPPAACRSCAVSCPSRRTL
jgi:hypothetical protein